MTEYNGIQPLMHRRKLPQVPAIYHVFRWNTLLYVGQTINLYARWNKDRHTQIDRLEEMDQPKGSVRIGWIVTDKGDLARVEREHIRTFNPPLNVRQPRHPVLDKYDGVDISNDYGAFKSLVAEITR